METINEHIDVNVPINEAYNQWTQFEAFPEFVRELKEVRQLDDRHVHWRAEVAGTPIEWDSEITQQIPDELIAWRTIHGPQTAGYVEFESVSPSATRVTVQMSYEPPGAFQHVVETLGPPVLRLRRELAHFKEFLERRGNATGAWRGSIQDVGEL